MRAYIPQKRTPLLNSLVILILLLSQCPAYSEQTRDLIIVVDISTSMADHIEEAKAQAKELISAAKPGDRVTIITFGGYTHLLERRRVNNPSDILRLLEKAEELQATELNTDLPLAMERGLQELQQFYDESPERERMLVWLSDDKHNPPPGLPNPITFQSLKQKQAGQLPDHDWFHFTSAIEEKVESDTDWFVQWAKRTPMALRAYPLSADLGAAAVPAMEKKVSVAFEPESKAVWGSLVYVNAEITSRAGPQDPKRVVIDPQVIVCDGTTWNQDFIITLPEKPGDYVCTLRFVPHPEEKFLHISPAEVKLRAQVLPEKEPVLAKSEGLRDHPSSFQLLSAGEFPERRKPKESGHFESRKEKGSLLSETMQAGTEYLSVLSFGLRKTSSDDAQEKGLLPLALIFQREFYLPALFTVLLFAAACLLLFLLHLLLKRVGWGKTHLAGTLEIMENPKYPSAVFNLQKIGRRRGACSLLIGKDPDADIVIPDPALDDFHAEIAAIKTKAGPLVFLRPLEGNGVFVNGVEIDCQKEIHSGDLITLGKTPLTYKSQDMRRETLIHFFDGNCLRGTLLSWDIDASTFQFLPKGAPSADCSMSISFSEIRTVSFLNKKTRALLKWFSAGRDGLQGNSLEVIFKDGQLLEGYTMSDSNTWKKRFYLIPKKSEEIALILVERSAVQQIFTTPTF